MQSLKLSDELAWRGLVGQTTLKNVSEIDNKQFVFYWGVDPSSDSMTIGNLAAAMLVRRFMAGGHKAVLLVGGATGLIGDPDGKKQERDLLSQEQINYNKKCLIDQYKSIFSGLEFEVVDNYDWFKDVNYLDFLRNFGKHVPMRQMLGREFVQSRLSEKGAGISYAEFSYSLIQGYDFLHLSRQKGVRLQLCGSDQWGNSIAGVDLIRRIDGKEAHVFSTPLIINKSSGVKFGKTEAGAIWLDPAKTSPFNFYQFWLNVDDDSVEDLLKVYTDIDNQVLVELQNASDSDKSSRHAQKYLAYQVTQIVHGKEAAETQQKIATALFSGGELTELSDSEMKTLTQELATAVVPASLNQSTIIDALVQTNLASSKSEARRFLQSNAIYINNEQIKSIDDVSYEISGNFALLRRGKNTVAILKTK